MTMVKIIKNFIFFFLTLIVFEFSVELIMNDQNYYQDHNWIMVTGLCLSLILTLVLMPYISNIFEPTIIPVPKVFKKIKDALGFILGLLVLIMTLTVIIRYLEIILPIIIIAILIGWIINKVDDWGKIWTRLGYCVFAIFILWLACSMPNKNDEVTKLQTALSEANTRVELTNNALERANSNIETANSTIEELNQEADESKDTVDTVDPE